MKLSIIFNGCMKLNLFYSLNYKNVCTIITNIDVQRHKKTKFLHYAKTKMQINCAVTAQLIRAFVFVEYHSFSIQNFKLLAFF